MKATLFILGSLGAIAAAAAANIPDGHSRDAPTHIIKFKRQPSNMTSKFGKEMLECTLQLIIDC